MAAVNNEYSVLDQDSQPKQPLYSLLVFMLLNPTYETANNLYVYLVENSLNFLNPLSDKERYLLTLMQMLMPVLYWNRRLDTGDPLWLVVLNQAQYLAQPPPPPPSKVVYVLRRMADNPFKYGVFATTEPLYTEQTFSTREMAEYALYRNQPFASVYDNYFDNTEYGASAPKYYRRIIGVVPRSKYD